MTGVQTCALPIWLVGVYLTLAPHGSAGALLTTTGVLAGVLVLAAISAGLARAQAVG